MGQEVSQTADTMREMGALTAGEVSCNSGKGQDRPGGGAGRIQEKCAHICF